MEIYTKADWHNDHNFSAKPGQEIEYEIYDEMLNVLPPERMPMRDETAGYIGFCVGEPASTDERGAFTYSTFGRRNGKYYYLGDFPLDDRTAYTEIAKLRAMLNNSIIPYRWHDRSKRTESGEILSYMYQITYKGKYAPPNAPALVSVVEGSHTEGGEKDLLEMQLLGEDAIGNLTAEDAFAQIKKHWDDNGGW